MNTSIINFDYKGSEISFMSGSNVMVNATQMAKSFGKAPKDWLRTNQTQEFITTLSAVRQICPTQLVEVKQGNSSMFEQGTWMHEDVALEFARWLSPAFAIWCNDRIRELLKTGVATVSNDDEAIAYAMGVLQKRLEQAKADKQRLEQENYKRLPKAEFADKIIATDNKIDIGQASKILNLGYGRNTLFSKLRESGIFFKNRNEPKQQYVDSGYFELKEQFIERDNHPGFTIIKVLVTQKGLSFIHKILGGNISYGKLAKIA